MKYNLINGNSAEVLRTFPDNHFDSVVCDPPYLIDFLGKDWDSKDNDLTHVFKECLRVLKPGGHLLAFSAARTYHKIATMIEDSGFEIRDQITWIYSSGFPKSQDVGRQIQRSLGVKEYDGVVDTTKNAGFGQTDHARVRAGVEWSTQATEVGLVKVTDGAAKEWSGWGTQLKPASEPICMARKPMKQTIAKNCQQWGTGAINIDAGRIALSSNEGVTEELTYSEYKFSGGGEGEKQSNLPSKFNPNNKGRFPSNVIGEIPEYQKFFYCPKVSRKERHLGHDLSKIKTFPEGKFDRSNDPGNGNERILNRGGNNHPTVKPIALMDYLIKLVTKPGGKVLDPFNGSGSTGCAAVKAGYEYTGIDLDPNYIEISRKRIEAWCKEDTNFNELFDETQDN